MIIYRGVFIYFFRRMYRIHMYLGTSYIASAKTWRRTLARVVLLVCDYVLDLYARYVSKYIATYLCQPHNRHHTPNQLASTQIFFFFFLACTFLRANNNALFRRTFFLTIQP